MKFFEISWLYQFDKLMLFKLKSFEIKVKQCIFDNHKKKSRLILQVEEKMTKFGPIKGIRGVLNRGNTLPAIQGSFEASEAHMGVTRRQKSEIGQFRHSDSIER